MSSGVHYENKVVNGPISEEKEEVGTSSFTVEMAKNSANPEIGINSQVNKSSENSSIETEISPVIGENKNDDEPRLEDVKVRNS